MNTALKYNNDEIKRDQLEKLIIELESEINKLSQLNPWDVKSKCQHNKMLVYFVNSINVKQYEYVCDKCGTIMSSMLAKKSLTYFEMNLAPNRDELPIFINNGSYWQKRNKLYDELREIKNQLIKLTPPKIQRLSYSEFSEKYYNQYLQSDVWKDLRQRIFARDSFLCQVCLKNKATAVHHLSYDSLFNPNQKKDFAFNLISICNECHSIIHYDK